MSWRRTTGLWSRIHLCPEGTPSIRRDQSSSVRGAPGTTTDDKPGLRAIDLARKIQQEKEKEKAKAKPLVDESQMNPQQKRVTELKRFSLQLQSVHPNVLAKHLHKSVLYQNQNVVVINKPYGVPVRDDTGVTSIESVLPVLSKMMDGMKIKSDSQLFPCLHLEKDVTGTLLLARNKAVEEQMLTLYKTNEVQINYWVIAVGVPVPSEGIIDIPVIEREVPGPRPHYKMALSPVYKMNVAGDGVMKVRSNREALPAVTKYRVLDSRSGCCLVELHPLTRVKHQLRVHMAYALGCPILGDHKYSHWNKLAPQRLPERVLEKLGLEQAKIRHLPLHVHARRLTFQRNSLSDINVFSPLPKYFQLSMNHMKLSKSANDT